MGSERKRSRSSHSKKIKKKSHKKEKQKKSRRHRTPSSSSSISSSNSGDWVEVVSPRVEVPADSTAPSSSSCMLAPDLTSQRSGDVCARSEGEESDAWSAWTQGTDYRQEKSARSQSKKAEQSKGEAIISRESYGLVVMDPTKPASSHDHVTDGGSSWLRRAFERAVEQSAIEHRPVEEIICERWGSTEKFAAFLPGGPFSRSDRSVKPASQGWRKPESKASSIALSTSTDQIGPTQGSLTSSAVAECSGSVESARFIGPNNGPCTDEPDVIDMKASRPMSAEERNSLSAKLLRAELSGNERLAQELRAQLTSGMVVDRAPKNPSEHVVILTRVDAAGNALPVCGKQPPTNLSRRSETQTHDKSGSRVRYFPDDDRHGLNDLVRQEQSITSDDMNRPFFKLTKRAHRVLGDATPLDDMFETSSADTRRAMQDSEKQMKRAEADHRHMDLVIEKCPFCLENTDSAVRQLILCSKEMTFLCAPQTVPLQYGHCLIVPISHVSGSIFLDEDVSEEVMTWKRSLVEFFARSELEVLFMELYYTVRERRHMVVDCIPVPKSAASVVPMFFKKAILESDSTWAMNKKLLIVPKTGDLRKVVPRGLPYFAVEFGNDGGFAHVIEDTSRFPVYFGKEVLGGVLELEPRIWLKPPRQSFEEQLQYTHRLEGDLKSSGLMT